MMEYGPQFSLLLIISKAALGFELKINQPGLWLIPEQTFQTLQLGLEFNSTDILDIATNASEARVTVRVIPSDDWRLDFINDTIEFSTEEIIAKISKNILLSGYYWGRTKLRFYLTIDDVRSTFNRIHGGHNGTLLENIVTVGVIRASTYSNTIFIILGVLFIVINNINIGCQLDLSMIWECLKTPLGPLCGFVYQFIVMPALSFIIGELLFDDVILKLGFFILGCSPGGVMSNFWTMLFNGDLNLSITMTFVSTTAALGMMPLWIFTLGKTIIGNDEDLQIPFSKIIVSLVVLTVAIGLGIAIKYKIPDLAERLSKLMAPFTLIAPIVLCIMYICQSYKLVMLMTTGMYLAGFIVTAFGLLFGAVFALTCSFQKDRIIAVSIATAQQNTTIAYIALKTSLPDPDGDIASLPLTAQAIESGLAMLIFYSGYFVVSRFCRSKLEEEDIEEKTAVSNCVRKEDMLIIQKEKVPEKF